MTMHCRKYSATIPIKTCIARQTSTGYGWKGDKDPGCVNCAQGLEVMAKSEEKIVETKTCKNPACEMTGQPQPVDAFYKSKMFKGGFDPLCKKCRLAKQKDTRAAKKAAHKDVKPDPPPQIAAPETVDLPAPPIDLSDIFYKAVEDLRQKISTRPNFYENLITLDFTDRVELREQILKIALDEFRTPDQQIMFWINGHLAGKNRISTPAA